MDSYSKLQPFVGLVPDCEHLDRVYQLQGHRGYFTSVPDAVAGWQPGHDHVGIAYGLNLKDFEVENAALKRVVSTYQFS